MILNHFVALNFAVQGRAFDAEDGGGAAFVPAGGVEGVQDVAAFDFFQRERFVNGFWRDDFSGCGQRREDQIFRAGGQQYSTEKQAFFAGHSNEQIFSRRSLAWRSCLRR